MPRDYDTQLIESVAVRRRRVRDALLFGSKRSRRTFDENLGKLFASIALAGVACAGCTGWAFLQNTLAKQRQQQQRNFPTSYPTISVTVSPSAVSTTGYGTPETTEPSPTATQPTTGMTATHSVSRR